MLKRALFAHVRLPDRLTWISLPESVMWQCPKCAKSYDDGSKICRQCGAILEEVAGAGPPQSLERWDDGSEVSDNGEAIQVPTDLHDAGGQDSDAVIASSPWTCSACGEDVPATFDMCWQCGTSRDHPVLPDFDAAPAEVDRPQSETGKYLRRLAEEHGRNTCPKCGSSRMMHDLRLHYSGQGSETTLSVVFYGSPEAIIFKDAHYGEMVSDVCGVCGHVELRVTNAQDLYDHYRDSQQE